MYGFLVSKETLVLRLWERSRQKFGFIKRVDKGWISTVKDFKQLLDEVFVISGIIKVEVIKQLLDSVFVISGIIKASVSVISRSRRLITLTYYYLQNMIKWKKSHRKNLSFFYYCLASCHRISVVVVIDRAQENARRGWTLLFTTSLAAWYYLKISPLKTYARKPPL